MFSRFVATLMIISPYRGVDSVLGEGSHQTQKLNQLLSVTSDSNETLQGRSKSIEEIFDTYCQSRGMAGFHNL